MSSAVFLDRDGVINAPPDDKRYITSWEEFRFLPGALSALRQLHRGRRRVIVVSNQAGVGRGWMSASALSRITRNMLEAIRESGGKVDAVFHCTHAPEAGCPCRKPRLGLIRRACRRWPIDLKRSVVIGDHLTDIAMGQSAGCRTVLVLTGATKRSALRGSSVRPDRVARNLVEAVEWMLQHDNWVIG